MERITIDEIFLFIILPNKYSTQLRQIHYHKYTINLSNISLIIILLTGLIAPQSE